MPDERWHWMGTPEAAAYLGVNQRTLYRLIDIGDVPAYQLGRVIRLRRHELDDYLTRSRLQPGDLAERHQYVAAAKWQWTSRDEREMRGRLETFIEAYQAGAAVTCPLCGDETGAGEAPRHMLRHT